MKKSILALATLSLCASPVTWAQPERLPFEIHNTLQVGYDDNVFTTGDGAPVDKQESFFIRNELQFILATSLNATDLTANYRPALTWYDDRPGDSTDWSHQLDLSANHWLSPISRFRVRNTLRYAQEPELVADDVTVRRANDFLYNSLNGMYETQVRPQQTTFRVDGRYAVMRYDDSDVSDISDYDLLAAGVDLVQQLTPNCEGGLELRYETYDYEDDFRDVDAIQAGVSLSNIMGPTLHGDVRFGYEYRDADAALEQTSDSPYIDGTLVYLPLEGTRLSVGAGYSKAQSPLSRFAQQDRLRLHSSLAHDLTPAMTLILSGSYTQASFDRDDATDAFDPETHRDGDEDILQLSTRLVYQVDVRNSIEAAYRYTELDSDVRPGQDFERNRVTLGWKYSL